MVVFWHGCPASAGLVAIAASRVCGHGFWWPQTCAPRMQIGRGCLAGWVWAGLPPNRSETGRHCRLAQNKWARRGRKETRTAASAAATDSRCEAERRVRRAASGARFAPRQHEHGTSDEARGARRLPGDAAAELYPAPFARLRALQHGLSLRRPRFLRPQNPAHDKERATDAGCFSRRERGVRRILPRMGSLRCAGGVLPAFTRGAARAADDREERIFSGRASFARPEKCRDERTL